MEVCPRCGYQEPVNNRPMVHVSNKYVNEKGERAVIGSDADTIENAGGTWKKVDKWPNPNIPTQPTVVIAPTAPKFKLPTKA